MKKFLISLLILFTQNIFSQDFQWAKQFGNTEDDRIIASDVDNDGNVYLLGESNSYTFDLNPNVGQEIINNNTTDIYGNICFIVKLDSDGNYVWGKVFNNGIRSYYDKVFDIKIGADSNIYALIDVYTYTGNQTITDAQNVVVKLDINGNELFVKSIKNLQPTNTFTNYIQITSFDLDSLNNIYLGGHFFGQRIVLDQSNSQLDLTSTGAGIFSLKMDNNGNYLWKLCPNIHTSEFNSLIIRPDGNLNIVYNSTYPSIICRLLNVNTTNGSIIWEKTFDNLFNIGTFEVSNNGNIILSCNNGTHFTSPVIDVDLSANVQNTSAPLFLLCLNSNGDFLDVKEYFADNINLNVIKSDLNNNIYVSGSFNNNYNLSFDADPSSNIFILASYSYQYGEGFYIKFNSSFEFENAIKLGQANSPPTPYDNIYLLRFTNINFKNDNIYFTGFFAGYGDLDPSNETVGFDTFHSSATINNDGFILKLGTCDTRSPIGDSNQYFCSTQNPTVANLTPNTNSIRWYDSLTSTTQLPTTNSLTNGQIYYATKNTGTCPESTDRLAVTVHIIQTPELPIALNQAFCENDDAIISDLIVSGVNLNWYNINVGESPLASNTILQNNTTYYVSQTVNSCESNRVAVNVTIIPNILPTTTSQQQFCIQQSATLNTIAISGQNIKWYDTQSNGNLLPNNLSLVNGTTYFASQTINDCESTRVPVTINIQDTPTPTGDINQSFCTNENATLTDINVIATNIKWYSSSTSTTSLDNSTILTNNTTYYASQTINNCESVNRLGVNINLINTLNANNYTEIICDELNDNSEVINLTSYNSNLISSTGNDFRYYNTYNNALDQNSSGLISNFATRNLIIGNNIFYVRIDSPNTCFQIVTLTLVLVSKPIIPINNIVPICEGNSIILNAGNDNNTYNWSTGETSQQITIMQPGNYSVVVTKNHGATICTTTKNFKVVNSNIATIQEITTSDWTDNNNTITVLLNSTSQGDYEYSINGIDFQQSNVFNNLESGEYTVFVKDKNDCGIVSKEVSLLMYPKFFTPNGDGYNDLWKIKFSQTETNLTILIFDRFTKLLKQITPNLDGWDGTYLGQELPSSDYWFVVKRNNGKEYKGHFSLKR